MTAEDLAKALAECKRQMDRCALHRRAHSAEMREMKLREALKHYSKLFANDEKGELARRALRVNDLARFSSSQP